MRKITAWLKTQSKFIMALPLVFMADKAFAQVGDQTVKPIPILGDVKLPDLVNTIINVILWGAGVIAVVYLIWGGITYITAGGDADKASKGRTAITNAIIGIVIIAAALAIYNFVIGQIGG